jgi:hypothetical protein
MTLGCAIEEEITVLKKKDFLELDVNLVGYFIMSLSKKKKP